MNDCRLHSQASLLQLRAGLHRWLTAAPEIAAACQKHYSIWLPCQPSSFHVWEAVIFFCLCCSMWLLSLKMFIMFPTLSSKMGLILVSVLAIKQNCVYVTLYLQHNTRWCALVLQYLLTRSLPLWPVPSL